MAHGAYHFYETHADPVEQAHHFVSVVQGQNEGSMLPVLDLEQASIKGEVKDIPKLQKDILTWLRVVEEKLGVQPMIYTNNPFGNKYLGHPNFEKYHLWLAEYGVKTPRIPKTWKNKGWSIWQRSEKGSEPGFKEDFDHDIVHENYTLKDLQFPVK